MSEPFFATLPITWKKKALPTIIISASGEKLKEELKGRHLVGLSKPLELTDLLQTIERVFARSQSKGASRARKSCQ